MSENKQTIVDSQLINQSNLSEIVLAVNIIAMLASSLFFITLILSKFNVGYYDEYPVYFVVRYAEIWGVLGTHFFIILVAITLVIAYATSEYDAMTRISLFGIAFAAIVAIAVIASYNVIIIYWTSIPLSNEGSLIAISRVYFLAPFFFFGLYFLLIIPTKLNYEKVVSKSWFVFLLAVIFINFSVGIYPLLPHFLFLAINFTFSSFEQLLYVFNYLLTMLPLFLLLEPSHKEIEISSKETGYIYTAFLMSVLTYGFQLISAKSLVPLLYVYMRAQSNFSYPEYYFMETSVGIYLLIGGVLYVYMPISIGLLLLTFKNKLATRIAKNILATFNYFLFRGIGVILIIYLVVSAVLYPSLFYPPTTLNKQFNLLNAVGLIFVYFASSRKEIQKAVSYLLLKPSPKKKTKRTAIPKEKEISKPVSKPDFQEIYQEYLRSHAGVLSKNILTSVPEKDRQAFGNWLADKLIKEGKHELAKDILIEINELEKAIPVIISLAVYYKAHGNAKKARELYDTVANIYRQLGDLQKAKEIEKEINSL